MHMLFNTDRVPDKIEANLQGLSWSFSHFFLWRGFGILFDCGEQAMRLDSHIFRADAVAISHGHFDHVRGLLGVVQARAGLMGANDKPLRVLFPSQSGRVTRAIDEVESFVRGKDWDHITFHGIADGDSVEFPHGRRLEAKRVEHMADDACLAYRIVRDRTRLKPEFRHLSKGEVKRLVGQGERDRLLESFLKNELVYSGDLVRLDHRFCQSTHVLMHEASFLREEDRDADKGLHSTVEQALRCAADAEARCLILWHVGRRYQTDELREGIQRLIDETGYERPVFVIRGSFRLPTD